MVSAKITVKVEMRRWLPVVLIAINLPRILLGFNTVVPLWLVRHGFKFGAPNA